MKELLSFVFLAGGKTGETMRINRRPGEFFFFLPPSNLKLRCFFQKNSPTFVCYSNARHIHAARFWHAQPRIAKLSVLCGTIKKNVMRL